MKKLYTLLTIVLFFNISSFAQTWDENLIIVESFPFETTQRSSPLITMMNGKGVKYNMTYTTLKSNMNEITAVYFIPEGYDKYNEDNIEPPRFEKLVLHNLGDDNKNFAGVWVKERTYENFDFEVTFSFEIRLPDDIANKLIDMLYGDYKLPPNKDLKKDCIKKVFDSKLLPSKEDSY
jgi:hypothetical protein